MLYPYKVRFLYPQAQSKCILSPCIYRSTCYSPLRITDREEPLTPQELHDINSIPRTTRAARVSNSKAERCHINFFLIFTQGKHDSEHWIAHRHSCVGWNILSACCIHLDSTPDKGSFRRVAGRA